MATGFITYVGIANDHCWHEWGVLGLSRLALLGLSPVARVCRSCGCVQFWGKAHD